MVQNKGLIFKKSVHTAPVPGEHLVTETREFDLDAAPPKGGFTTKNLYFSFDPYQRGRMRDPKIKSYNEPMTIGEPITNLGIGKVLKSDNPRFEPGDVICAFIGAEEYSAIPAVVANLKTQCYKLPSYYKLDPKLYIGALGMPGRTAYSSLYEIAKPKKGQTIWVSSASGAVGQIVGQLAKHEGLKVIGSVGADDKLEFITKTLGFDAGFNYKKEKPADALARLAPDGIDIYYDNVGGEHLEAAIDNIKTFGRIVACGMISQYNLPAAERYPIRNLQNVVSKRLLMEGFIVTDERYGGAYFDEHQKKVGQWLSDGSFNAVSDVTDGLDNAAHGFVNMLKGDCFGKPLVKIADMAEVRSML